MARAHRCLAGLVFVLASLAAPRAGAEAQAIDLIVRNARLLDGTNGVPTEDATILISGGRITEVISGASPHLAREVIDAAGFTVVPGLVDAHHHLLIEAPAAPGQQRRYRPAVE